MNSVNSCLTEANVAGVARVGTIRTETGKWTRSLLPSNDRII